MHRRHDVDYWRARLAATFAYRSSVCGTARRRRSAGRPLQNNVLGVVRPNQRNLRDLRMGCDCRSAEQTTRGLARHCARFRNYFAFPALGNLCPFAI